MVRLDGKSISSFLQAIHTKATEENYLVKLKLFFDFGDVSADDFAALAKKHPAKAESIITSYIQSRKGKVSGSTIRTFKVALKLFLSMNDSDKLNWTRISKLIPKSRKYGSDRAPTSEELRKILDNCDLRMKCVVLVLLSSGIRIGAFEGLQWRDMEPVKFGNHEFAKLTVYRGENEQYYTFVTPECHKYLLEYKDLRQQAGEKINPNSLLIRDDWGNYKGATDPTKATAVTPKSLRNALGRLHERIGLRSEKTGIRHEFQQAHGFRKFFKSLAERYMKSIYVELLMGHSTGVSDSYMKPSYQDMVQEYSKTIPALSILSREEVSSADQLRIEFKKMLLATSGYRDDEIKNMDLANMTNEQIQEKARERLMVNNGQRQRIIATSELERHITQGWEFVANPPGLNGKSIVRLPA